MSLRMLFLVSAAAFASGCDSESASADPTPGDGGVETDGAAAADQGSAGDGAAADGSAVADAEAGSDAAIDSDAAVVDAGETQADAALEGPDGAVATPDAFVATPDAFVATPDAFVATPDAFVERNPMTFFVTSLEAMQRLSGSEHGFGGDFGGINGADQICQSIAEGVGAGHQTWRAFLSATRGGPDGGPIHAIDRIGNGPWHDANQRLVAENLAGLAGDRPAGDLQSVLDLPDEHGVPLSVLGDSHDVPTGSNRAGRLDSDNPESTCNDWTSAAAIGGNIVKCGHSFPRRAATGRGANWVSDHALRGCTPGVNLLQNGAGEGTCIGCSGGYGALYCFALQE